MGASTIECISDSQKTAFDRATGSRVLTHKACYVYAASIVSDGVGAADAALYDGESDQDEIKKDLACAAGGMSAWLPGAPVYFGRGVYVKIGSNVKSIDVQYLDAMRE